jgi:dienelactone hydrolase
MTDHLAAGVTAVGVTPPAAAPVLPPISDPAQPGPFGAEVVATAPGLETHKLYVPGKLGDNGVKHPIVVWTNGAGGSTDFYENLLRHFASHGFFVVADKMSGGNHNPEIVEQKAGIEWAIAEAQRADSPYAGKLDASRIAVAGHSLGSISSFASAAHPAVKASIHWSAGLTGNPVGAEEAWLQGLHAPAAFFCGGAEPRALPRCSGDFDNAPPSVPIFYGTVEGVGHTDVYGEPNAGQWGRAGVAWFRFTLAGDESFRSWFHAPMCTLCSSPWTGMSRGI